MVDGDGLWSGTSIAEFMPPLRGTALEPRFPSSTSDYDRGECRWKRGFSLLKTITWLR